MKIMTLKTAKKEKKKKKGIKWTMEAEMETAKLAVG